VVFSRRRMGYPPAAGVPEWNAPSSRLHRWWSPLVQVSQEWIGWALRPLPELAATSMMVSSEKGSSMATCGIDERPVLREALCCDMPEGRTRLTNYSGNFIILPPSLQALWRGILSHKSVGELVEIHLEANYLQRDDSSRDQALAETQELLDLLIDRRIVSIDHMPLWEAQT
jgi:hypothetical protein